MKAFCWRTSYARAPCGFFSARLYTIIGYGVDETTQQLDYDEIEKLALEYRPK